MTNLHDARVEAAARELFHDPLSLGDYTWEEMVVEDKSRADLWRDDARRVLAAADAVVTVEMIAEVILKSLVFTDATSMAWANGVARNVLALIRGGGEQ
jgi:hypothetical protein